ncbi:MAG: hypothetical protein QHI48_04385 [Bacteroidota bacterium]|nr:hypothetical protein [Bacteroidota bacterium]
MLLKPFQGFDIEGVGRLVVQQNSGFAQEHFRERYAHLPAATELHPHSAEFPLVETEAGEYLRGFRFDVPALAVLEHVLDALTSSTSS